jgi:hypothetical protein
MSRPARTEKAGRLPAWSRTSSTILVVEVLVSAHGDFTGAPRLKGTDQNRRRQRRADKHQLLEQHTLNRTECAEHGNQKRDWQDWRHRARPMWRQAQCLFASRVRNVGTEIFVPHESRANGNVRCGLVNRPAWNPLLASSRNSAYASPLKPLGSDSARAAAILSQKGGQA